MPGLLDLLNSDPELRNTPHPGRITQGGTYQPIASDASGYQNPYASLAGPSMQNIGLVNRLMQFPEVQAALQGPRAAQLSHTFGQLNEPSIYSNLNNLRSAESGLGTLLDLAPQGQQNGNGSG